MGKNTGPFDPCLGIGEGVGGGEVRAQTEGNVGVVAVVRDGRDVRDVVAADEESRRLQNGRRYRVAF